MTDRASWELAPGDEIVPGRTVEKRLGGGAMAEVYLASDAAMLAPVVVKMLRPDQVDDRHRRRLADEADILAALGHPMILRLLDRDLEGERPHLVLELVEGPRLSSLLRKYGPLPLEQAVPLAVELCSALHYLHGRGYVHLDVKPGNIVMAAPPRLIDLSVARTVDDAAQLRSPVGTDPYMAPEQCEPGPGGVGPAADIWAVGVTLHQAVVGERPFPRGTDEDRWPQLHTEPRALPGWVAPIYADAIRACLVRDPSQRPSAAELAEMLQPIVEALPRKPVLGRIRPRLVRRRA